MRLIRCHELDSTGDRLLDRPAENYWTKMNLHFKNVFFLLPLFSASFLTTVKEKGETQKVKTRKKKKKKLPYQLPTRHWIHYKGILGHLEWMRRRRGCRDSGQDLERRNWEERRGGRGRRRGRSSGIWEREGGGGGGELWIAPIPRYSAPPTTIAPATAMPASVAPEATSPPLPAALPTAAPSDPTRTQPFPSFPSWLSSPLLSVCVCVYFPFLLFLFNSG